MERPWIENKDRVEPESLRDTDICVEVEWNKGYGVSSYKASSIRHCWSRIDRCDILLQRWRPLDR